MKTLAGHFLLFRSARIRPSTRRRVPFAALLALAALFASFAGCRREAEGPPVVVAVIDTLRADHVGAYGHARPTTPTLDRLAADGVLFERAFTTAPRTWQSFTTILTGLYPPRHGVRFIYDHPLASNVPTLASVLGKQGYETAAFDTMRFVEAMTGGNAFHQYFEPPRPGRIRKLVDRALGKLSLDRFFPGTRARSRSTWHDADVARAFRSWLDGKKSGFFAFLRLTDPHWAYECEPYFHGEVKNHDAIDHSFNSGSYGLRPGERGFQLTDTEAYRRLHYTRYPPPVLEHMVLHYDECVRQSDTALGEIFAALRERGIYDDALIVVTSDHGEGFWEHGYLQHGIHLDDVVTRVPLVVKLPGNEFAGTRVSQLVRTVDIMPTVLDALGIPAPQDLDGTSLLPAVREGRNLGLVAYAESGKGFVGVDPELYVPGVKGKWRMIRTDRWKLVHIPDGKAGIDRLYDLLEDPGEKVDVAAQHPDIVEKLKGELAKIQRWETDEKERELSPEEEEQLRQLGYM